MATYYLNAATGSDSNDGLSEANAWASFYHAGSETDSNDIVYAKGGTIYSESHAGSTFVFSSTTANRVLVVEGYTSTPGDGGMAIVDADSTSVGATMSGNVVVRNIEVRNAVYNGFNTGYSANGTHVRFENCVAKSCGSDGFSAPSGYVTLINCKSYNNSANGVDLYDGEVIGCTIHNNTERGIYDRGTGGVGRTLIMGCLLYENQSDAIRIAGTHSIIMNCTIDGTDSSSSARTGITLYEDVGGVVINTIFFDCSYAAQIATNTASNIVERVTHDNNSFYENMVGNLHDGYTSIPIGSNSITSDPKFTDEANDDYTLESGSPCIGAGYKINPANVQPSIGCFDVEAGSSSPRAFRGRIIGG